MIDFSANINPLGPPSQVINALTSESFIQWYPDSTEFIDELSQKFRIPAESIIVGNGSTALIFASVRAMNPKRALLVEPAFGEYYRALEATGSKIDTYVLKESRSFLPDFTELYSVVHGCQPDLVLLNNPHNPSGALCSRHNLIRFASEMQVRSCLIVDEAFVDYCPEESLVPHILELSNVIVIRSLTKFYAIPGLRIGYAICNPELAQKIRQQIEAWPVSSIALQTGTAAISDQKYDEMVRTKNEIVRNKFAEDLNQIPGVTVFPSSANFLLVKFRTATGANLAKYLEHYAF